MKKIVLCIDARMINSSGIGVTIQQYVYALLQSKKYEITLLGKRDELDAYFRGYESWNHIEANFPIYTMQEQIRLSLLIPYCDVFWSPHYNVPLLPIRARKRLVTVHDVFHLAYYKSLSIAQKIYAKVVIKFAVSESNRVITVSRYSKKEIIKYTNVSEEKIDVIYNGVDKDKFVINVRDEVKSLIKQKYELPEQYILFVGNVKPHKNIKNLIYAFSNIVEEFPNCKLVIVGKKEGFITGSEDLLNYDISGDNKLAEKIFFTGFVDSDDLPVIYNMATVFVFPSLYEGFGLPPLEAMACGCATVVSNITSMPEICGNASYYVDPNDTDSISSGISAVLKDHNLRAQLVETGFNQCNKYSWIDASNQFIEIIDRINA